MTDYGWKRKSIVGTDVGDRGEWSIYFLFHSWYSPNAAALYELKVTGYGGDHIFPQDDVLKQVATFFNENENKHTNYAACAPLGSGKYFLMPNEFDRKYEHSFKQSDRKFDQDENYPREYPRIFDLVTNEAIKLDNLPLGRKVDPIAVTLSDNIYVLARRGVVQPDLPEPSFEAYDPKKNTWQTLNAPWFNKNIPRDSLYCTLGWYAQGYAVLGEFIIVCFRNRRRHSEHAIYSYNTLAGEWKPVRYTNSVVVYDDGSLVDSYDNDGDYEDDDDENEDVAEYRIWDGEAVVINNFIYVYELNNWTMFSYSCTKASGKGCDLSLGEKIVVERREAFDCYDMMKGGCPERSGAIGKIGEDLISLVKTMFTDCVVCSELQPVHVMIYRILEGGRYSKLKSFDLYMPGGERFHFGMISSCFILQKDLVCCMKHEEQSPKKNALSFEDGVAGMVSEMEMMEKIK